MEPPPSPSKLARSPSRPFGSDLTLGGDDRETIPGTAGGKRRSGLSGLRPGGCGGLQNSPRWPADPTSPAGGRQKARVPLPKPFYRVLGRETSLTGAELVRNAAQTFCTRRRSPSAEQSFGVEDQPSSSTAELIYTVEAPLILSPAIPQRRKRARRTRRARSLSNRLHYLQPAPPFTEVSSCSLAVRVRL